MASHSPTDQTRGRKGADHPEATQRRSDEATQGTVASLTDELEYTYGWAAMTKLMHQGYSWSGRERKCCYLNLGDGTFANVSATSGLDFLDDGRAVAACDWDGDGLLDLWLKNRTGPQLRFLRNNTHRDEHFLALKLAGKKCNRDAVGAVVEVHSGGRKLLRGVACGDGYLSQSSKWLHFGLGADERIDRVVVRWPGGESQTLQGLRADRRYSVEQGTVIATEIPVKTIELAEARAQDVSPPGHVRIVLRVPLPLLPMLAETPFGRAGGSSDKPAGKLIAFWAHWCPPCMGELRKLAKHRASLNEMGIEFVALNLDEITDRDKANTMLRENGLSDDNPSIPVHFASEDMKKALEVVVAHVLDQREKLSLPLSFLIDGDNSLQVIYVGPLSFDDLAADFERFVRNPRQPSLRGAFSGRWYFRIPRDFAELSRELKERGLIEESRLYTKHIR